MGLDHSKAFVRLTFDGIITLCINKRAEPDRCELGMVATRDHQRRLTITRIRPNGVEEQAYPPFELNNENRVVIETENSITPGVTTFEPGTFNRLADEGDPEDFRWIMDLQGPEFHEDNLSLRRESDRLCRPKIIIHHGVFYTHSKTPHRYFRYPREGNPINTGSIDIGKIADKVGADIVADPVLGKVIVQITGKTPNPIELVSDGLKTRYRIDIGNLCRTGCVQVSDFPEYYSVASDRDGVEFDIYPQIPTGAPGFTKPLRDFIRDKTGFDIPLPAHFERFRANGPPEVCSVGGFGRTNTIPE